MGGVEKVNRGKGFTESRRQFLRTGTVAGLGLSGLPVSKAVGTENRKAEKGESMKKGQKTIYKVEFKVLDKHDKFDIREQEKEIIKKAYQLGYDLEKEHGGCCRCTVAALQKAIEFIPEDKGLFRAAGCLDGGATPKEVQNCGAFTGLGMVIGWVCGRDGFQKNKLAHNLIRKVYTQFEKEYESVLCRDVKKKAKSDCPVVVANAAKWTTEVLLRQFTNYTHRV
jgi:Putative redox-active protein (C_GCAxxG_C_C)